MIRRGFSLIEMLVATALASVLMTGLLFALAAVSRDRRAFSTAKPPADPGLVDLIRWDLTNSRTLDIARGDVILTGVDGIDPASLEPNGRFVRVTYRLDSGHTLWRDQRYLDDPSPTPEWTERVASDVSAFSLVPTAGTPDHVRLQIAVPGQSIDQTLELR